MEEPQSEPINAVGLTVKEVNGVYVVSSAEVAPMVDKDHRELLRSIRTYIGYLDGAKLHSENFFIKSTYINSRNQEQPCFLLTKKGCDMVANKMTGEKGVIFTATYINKFYEMEEALKNQTANVQLSMPELLRQLADKMEESLAVTNCYICVTNCYIQRDYRISKSTSSI